MTIKLFSKLMRHLIVIALTSLAILACKEKSPRELLIGTWKLRDMLAAGDSVIGTATFSKANTLLLKTFVNGKIADTKNGSYELSPDNKLLTTKIDTSTIKFEITKLTNDVLELNAMEKINVTTRYIRYD
jgi:hypothetical protein